MWGWVWIIARVMLQGLGLWMRGEFPFKSDRSFVVVRLQILGPEAYRDSGRHLWLNV
jgi:hypothetical protein